MKISQNTFFAEIPKRSANLLPDGFAQIAENCNLESGSIYPFKAPLKQEAIVPTSAKSLYRWSETGGDHWITSDNELHFVKSPIAGDTYDRVYFTGETEARFLANDNINPTAFDFTADYYKLGIPAPTTAPTVTTTGGGAVYKAYVYAFVNSYGDEGPPSPVGSDNDYSTGAVAITAIEAAPADRAIDTVRLYRTNASGTGTAEFQFVLDATWFSTAVAYAVGDFVVYSNQIYKCTTIHPAGAWNAGHFTAGDDVSDADLLRVYPKTLFDPPPTGLKGLIGLAYGSLAGFVGNQLYISEPYYPHAYPAQYVIGFDADIIGIGNENNLITVFTEGAPYTVYGNHPSQMAKTKSSQDYPGLYIRGVTSGNSGVFGVTRHGIAFSTESGIANITQALMSKDDISGYGPATAAIYWFDKKLFLFDSVGQQGIIIDFSGPEEGSPLKVVPLSIYAHACFVSGDGYFYMVMDDESVVDENDPPANMPLCIKLWDGSTTNYLLYTYRSKEFVLTAPYNFSAAKVTLDGDFADNVEDSLNLEVLNSGTFAAGLTGYIGADYPLAGGHELAGDEMISIEVLDISADVTFKFYCDGVLRKTKTISAEENVFRLPSKYLGRKCYFEVIGYAPVKEVSIATSMDEL